MVNMTRGTALLAFADLVSSLGEDPRALMEAHGIDPVAAGDYDRFLSYTATAALIGDAAQKLDCPDFGMRLGRMQDIKILGPVAVIIRHSETVADALEGISRYLHNCAPADATALRRGNRVSAFTFDIRLRQLPHRDQMVEKGLAISLEALRLMVGDDFVPLKVTMQHRRISQPETYREVFECPVEFERELNSVHLPNHVLTRQIRGHDAAALTLAENYLAQVRPDHSFADHIRGMVERLLPVNQANLSVVAKEMAMHPRVIQRKLAETSDSFENILDDARRTKAWQLAGTGMAATQIATMLGYSEQSSYSRACRRWFGESPRQLAASRRHATAL